MAQHGRKIPQADGVARYVDPSGTNPEFPNVNPFFHTHRTFGEQLLPADAAAQHKGNWPALFGQDGPLHLEVGAGNGFFLEGLAKQHPNWNIIGLEIRYKRVVIAAKKLKNSGLTNARVVRYDASFLSDLFEEASLDAVYINHPDPWPKKRHEKHRIVSDWFLRVCAPLLRSGGSLRLKTDHRPHIDTLFELLGPKNNARKDPLPYTIRQTADDVTKGESIWDDDVETNFQKKFRLQGLPVYAVDVVRN